MINVITLYAPTAMHLKDAYLKLRTQELYMKKGHWDSGKTPPANKLHNVTSRLMSNTTRKYIFTEYRSSITQGLNDLDFDLSRSNLLVPLDSLYMVSYYNV